MSRNLIPVNDDESIEQYNNNNNQLVTERCVTTN